MRSNTLVSVIIPCFNQGKFLHDAVESVRTQTYPHWECIIINDGSTDDTDKTAKALISDDKRFRYHYQNNRGLPATRNTGLKMTGGAYIQFLDADDIIRPQKF